MIGQMASLGKVPQPIREAARVAIKNLSLPISEHVQALLRQQVDQDELVEADDILVDQTLIIPLPGKASSGRIFKQNENRNIEKPRNKIT